MTKDLTGRFAVRRVGASGWLLSGGPAGAPEVLLLQPGAELESLADAVVEQVAVAWRHDGVDVTLTSSAGVRAFRATSAIVHEPNARLYQSLPLAGFDADARRFWRRVFLLIRLPGGRRLLGLIARRRRGPGRGEPTKR